MRTIDLIGEDYGYWKVIARAGNVMVNGVKGEALWLCLCKCGNTGIVRGSQLRNKRSRSCGCLKVETTVRRCTKHGHNPMRGKRSPTYESWRGIISRCTNPKNKRWGDYGGRGVTICERWLDFANFLADMGERPKGRRWSIGRVDNAAEYRPENCRWEQDKQQARNKRNNRLITYRGETRCVAEWAEILKLPKSTIHMRLFQGWSEERALSTPHRGWGPHSPRPH